MKKTLVVIAFVLFLNNASLLAVSKYKINHMDLNQSVSFAYCINNHGVVSGSFMDSKNACSAFYWSEETGLVELPNGKYFQPYDINDEGKVVGIIKTSKSGLGRGRLISFDGDRSDWSAFRPVSINNSNIAVGNPGPSACLLKDLFLTDYTHKLEQKEPLNITSGLKLREKYGYHLKIHEVPRSINNKNEVVGNFEVHGDGPFTPLSFPFLWADEGVIHLGSGLAMDINDHSQVILSVMSNFSMCYLWENGKCRLMWNGGKALAINNHGIVVGFKEQGAVIWEDGITYDLKDLIENLDGWGRIDVAEDINDRGEIVGSGIYNGRRTAFLLTPCKE